MDGLSENRERKPKVALVGLGCRVNRSDVDSLAAELRGVFDLALPGEKADFVVVNTCTVTQDADSTSRQAIRRVAREYPGARIIAAGCYAETSPERLAVLPSVTAVVGTRAQTALPGLLRSLAEGREVGLALEEAAASAPDWFGPVGELHDHTRPFVKIQDGCDSGCTYCIVPAARGPGRSLPFDEALARIARLGERHAEVVLTGVHLGQYGQDLSPRRNLADLARALAERNAVHRLRFSSIEPLEFPLALVEEAKTALTVCEHFHIPCQSGSPRILEAMRRPYRVPELERLLERIACAAPKACIGTDVMVGFPGETDQDHRETVRLLERLPLAYLHVFPFSPRDGTVAFEMPEKVPGKVARERAAELLALSERRWRSFVASQLGRALEVVVERIESGVARGTSRQYVTARWPAGQDARGQVVSVRVEASDGAECLGVHSKVFSGRLMP